jgi:Endosomal/lysosomal potassium channel TMEM175
MAIPKPFAHRRHEVSRLEGFSDAVFAFAVTLLVVSLEVPRTFSELWHATRGFLAFAISFALLFQVWWRHHTYFRRYGLEDTMTKALTGVLLFVVLFYVYPLKFLWTLLVVQLLDGANAAVARFPDGRVEPMIHEWEVWRLFIVYGLGGAAVFGVFVALYSHAYRLRKPLGLDPLEVLETWLSVLSNIGMVVVALLSISIAIVGHLIGSLGVVVCAGYIYSIIGLFQWGIGEYGGRQRKKLNLVIG